MRFALVFMLACGGPQPAAQPKAACDQPEPGQAMTREQCACRDGRLTLSNGRAVELHCEAGEVELGAVRIGVEGGWCCKAQ